MAAGAWKMYGNALEQVLGGTIDWDSDSFRMVLLTSSHTPDLTHTAYSSLSSAEVADGNGYSTHGAAITATQSRAGQAITLDCDDQTWPGSTFSVKYAAIVRDGDGNGSLAAGDTPIMYCDLDTGGGSLSPSNGPLSVTVAGLYTITLES